VTRIALAYSGSLDGSAAIDWLRRKHAAEIVTVTLDLGQGRELEAIRDRALMLGAQRAHVLDARDRFAQAFVLPALRADALHDHRVPMALVLSRPLVAEKLVELAAIERADALAHTGGYRGGRSPLDELLTALAPQVPIVTPVREWGLTPEDRLAFAVRHGFGASSDGASRIETNFWGRSLRDLPDDQNPARFAPRPPESCPAEPAFVDIAFTRGSPTALNGVTMSLVELVGSLGTLAATHGVGHTRTGALACDAPAAVLLHAAHRDLTRAASTPEVEQFSAQARTAYVDLVERAQWFSPLRSALDAYFTAVQEPVTGQVRLRLLKGEHAIVATNAVASVPASAQSLRIVSSQTRH
jgi:argininosuccinate synthase